VSLLSSSAVPLSRPLDVRALVVDARPLSLLRSWLARRQWLGLAMGREEASTIGSGTGTRSGGGAGGGGGAGAGAGATWWWW
jgi:hypothetical protein